MSSPLSASARFEATSDELTALGLLNVVLRYRRRIIAVGVLAAMATAAVTLLKHRTYTSTAAFIPQTSRQTSSLGGLAAQLGLDVGAMSGTSPSFYADLARSKGVLTKLMDTTIAIPGPSGPKVGTIADHLEVEAPNPATRRAFAISELQTRITSGLDLATSVVTFSVSTENPHLSRMIGEMLLGSLNRFNLENRQSQAGAERRFAERRLAETSVELRQAEDALRSFRERNRAGGSPDLLTQQERLQREVGLRTAVYTTMAQAYEQAKLEEVRDTPVITVLEHPENAVFPDPRHLVGKTVLAFLVGILLAIAVALVYDRLARTKDVQADAMREFQELRRATLQDVRAPLRVFGAKGRKGQPTIT